MATRRSARQSSRQSSRGISPSYAEPAAAPLTVNRRAGPEPLPQVDLKSSTAYGKDPLSLATTRAGRHTGQVIENVLGDIIAPVRATPARETPGAASQVSRG
jgi:hypothetical protein